MILLHTRATLDQTSQARDEAAIDLTRRAVNTLTADHIDLNWATTSHVERLRNLVEARVRHDITLASFDRQVLDLADDIANNGDWTPAKALA